MGEGQEGNEDTKKSIKEGMGKCMEAMKEKMKEGEGNWMNGAKWFMLFPGLILITAFLLTFFLNPEAVQVLWLVITGILVGLGLTFMLMISLWFRKMKRGISA
jgi:uncharacterized integral membrane protein